jgi:hypothetical protein
MVQKLTSIGIHFWQIKNGDRFYDFEEPRGNGAVVQEWVSELKEMIDLMKN